MPTYEYKCEKCEREFAVEQQISAPALQECPLPSPRTREDRLASFNEAGGAISWNHRPFYAHPDRCVCQESDPDPHRHYDDDEGHRCARCSCMAYQPETNPPCGAPVRRLISGSTSFVLKGSGWYKDGY